MENIKLQEQMWSLTGISEWSSCFGGTYLLKNFSRDVLVSLKIQSQSMTVSNFCQM